MLHNYLQTAVRYFNKSKLHTVISVTGLTLGITSVFLITLYLQQELSYDRFHDHAGDLYRITWEDENPQTRTPHPMAQAMAADFPEVESAVSITPLYGSGLTLEQHSFRNMDRDERFDERRILAVDSTFFDVFSFPVTRGDARKALTQTNAALLISESMARKYFGEADPIGKQLAVDSDTMLIQVAAVFKDVPANSHFHFDFLISYVREKSFDGADDPYYSWGDFGHYNYIRLTPGSDPKALEAKLLDWVTKYIPISPENLAAFKAAKFGFRVQPVTDIHLQSHLRWELGVNGNMESIYILGAAALLILVIAGLNFMNLTAAKSTERAKEIGVRKSLGANRGQLITQFIGESMMISLLAVVLSVVLIELATPLFNQVTGSSIQVDFSQYVFILTGLGILMGLLSGVYPSLYLSASKPSAIMKGATGDAGPTGTFRDVMISFQFAMSMALISGAFIIYSQLDFLRQRDLGFNSENVLVVPIKSEEIASRFTELKTELERLDGIHSVSASSNIPGWQYNQNNIAAVEFPDDDIATSECMVDPDFFTAMQINLKEGRFFSSAAVADSIGAYILNETAASQLGLDNPVGREIYWYRDHGTRRGRVIGVVSDFHFQSLHEPIRPILFTMADNYNFIIIRGTFGDLETQLADIRAVYRQFDQIFQFEFSFLDDRLQQQYEGESRLGNVIAIFSAIAIAIACAGLFGMALLLFNRKVKEISIRKVLGATTLNLVFGLLKTFTIIVVLAGIAATPVTWWVMERWLSNFNYHVDVNAGVFAASITLLLLMSWATLSYLTLKTTRLNPADTLKTE
jgi:putative ABC transport system permease protein